MQDDDSSNPKPSTDIFNGYEPPGYRRTPTAREREFFEKQQRQLRRGPHSRPRR